MERGLFKGGVYFAQLKLDNWCGNNSVVCMPSLAFTLCNKKHVTGHVKSKSLALTQNLMRVGLRNCLALFKTKYIKSSINIVNAKSISPHGHAIELSK